MIAAALPGAVQVMTAAATRITVAAVDAEAEHRCWRNLDEIEKCRVADDDAAELLSLPCNSARDSLSMTCSVTVSGFA